MSEEIKKMNVFEAFKQSQLTYQEAEEKAKKEAGTPRVQKFRIGEDGEYAIRILPLAPSFDEDGNVLQMERKGYEYPFHQQFLPIIVPSKKGKGKKMNIPVIRTSDQEVGKSLDLIDTYVKIAREMYEGDDKELIDLITDTPYNGGLRWNYVHAIYVLDVSSDSERSKGPQLWQCSHSQYKEIDAAKMRLWKELRADDEQAGCPISGFTDAYPVKIIRKTEGKTAYTIEIGRKTLDLKEDELQKLIELPRIPEEIYRYTRYQFEATIVFLEQYDEKHEMEVCKQPDFKEAVNKLKGELSPDDQSHFDLATVSAKDDEKGGVTIDSLWADYDSIADQGLPEKSDEYQELREKIRQFIEDNQLDVRISRSKNNQQLLEEVEDSMDEAKSKVKKESEKEPEKTAERRPRPKAEEDDGVDGENEATAINEEPEVDEAPRRRRPRPTESNEVEESTAQKEEASKQEADDAEEEQPRRRLHTRRMR